MQLIINKNIYTLKPDILSDRRLASRAWNNGLNKLKRDLKVKATKNE